MIEYKIFSNDRYDIINADNILIAIGLVIILGIKLNEITKIESKY